MKLYHYYRSSASYRVRIALNYKNLDYTLIPVNLLNDGGEQHAEAYQTINPQQLVPTLQLDGQYLTQSLAIIEYLEEKFPQPALLPKDPVERAKVRGMAQFIACDIHPLNNLRVLNYLTQELSITEDQKMKWYFNWLTAGFNSLEKQLQHQARSNSVCIGNQPTLADLCLVPQVYNAKRFNFPLNDYPLINKINDYCLTLPAFIKAQPEAV